METRKYAGRSMPGPVTLAACLLELVDNLYARLIDMYDDEDPNKEALVLEWETFRNEWKPRLERVITQQKR